MRRFILLIVVLSAATAAFAQFRLLPLDVPGAVFTRPRGINNHGQIVGGYRMPGQQVHAMMISGGKVIPLAPSTVVGSNASEAFGCNDRGDVVGYYISDGHFRGFLLTKEGELTTLDFPGAGDTYVTGISEGGTVVGSGLFSDADGNLLFAHGFTWKDGVFSELNYPGVLDTWVDGINARGDVIGLWDNDPNALPGHGFVFRNGEFTSFDVPVEGMIYTLPNAINAQGQIVGTYMDSSFLIHGFLLAGSDFTQIDYPGATNSCPYGINSAGQIVGFACMPFNHAFLSQPGKIGKPPE